MFLRLYRRWFQHSYWRVGKHSWNRYYGTS